MTFQDRQVMTVKLWQALLYLCYVLVFRPQAIHHSWDITTCVNLGRTTDGFENAERDRARRGMLPLPYSIEEHCPTNPDILWTKLGDNVTKRKTATDVTVTDGKSTLW